MPARYSAAFRKATGIIKRTVAPHDEGHIDWAIMGQQTLGLNGEAYALVLLDIGLPGLNGYEVAKRLRQHSELKHTVLIALTGYGQDTDRQTSQQAGFNYHLVKPAKFEQLK